MGFFPVLKKLPLDKNPNSLILGTPGSGKSFAAKREIINSFLITQDDIIICDPESEYTPVVQSQTPTSKRNLPPSGMCCVMNTTRLKMKCRTWKPYGGAWKRLCGMNRTGCNQTGGMRWWCSSCDVFPTKFLYCKQAAVCGILDCVCVFWFSVCELGGRA